VHQKNLKVGVKKRNLLWTLPYKGRIIIGPREGTDRHVTDHDHLDHHNHHNHYDHQDSGKQHVYNDTPFRQISTLVVDVMD